MGWYVCWRVLVMDASSVSTQDELGVGGVVALKAWHRLGVVMPYLGSVCTGAEQKCRDRVLEEKK